jgi:hypothetical protein
VLEDFGGCPIPPSVRITLICQDKRKPCQSRARKRVLPLPLVLPQSYLGFWPAREVVDFTGTAGWIRTTDLLIHSLYQVFDFPHVCWKSGMMCVQPSAAGAES